MIVNRLKKYNKYKFQIEPPNRISAIYPLLLSPVISVLFISFFMCIFVGYLIVSNPEFIDIPSKTKGVAALEVTGMVSSLILFLSYMYTFIVIYPISYVLKHNNGRAFEFTMMLLSLFLFFIAYDLSLKVNELNLGALKMNVLVGPIIIFFISIMNTYSFKAMNELIKRDDNGKIVYKLNNKKNIITNDNNAKKENKNTNINSEEDNNYNKDEK